MAAPRQGGTRRPPNFPCRECSPPPPFLLLPPSLPTGLWAPTHLGGLQVGAVQDVVQSSLRQVQEGNGDSLSERERTDLKRRKLLLEVCVGTGAELDFGEGGGGTIRGTSSSSSTPHPLQHSQILLDPQGQRLQHGCSAAGDRPDTRNDCHVSPGGKQRPLRDPKSTPPNP